MKNPNSSSEKSPSLSPEERRKKSDERHRKISNAFVNTYVGLSGVGIATLVGTGIVGGIIEHQKANEAAEAAAAKLLEKSGTVLVVDDKTSAELTFINFSSDDLNRIGNYSFDSASYTDAKAGKYLPTLEYASRDSDGFGPGYDNTITIPVAEDFNEKTDQVLVATTEPTQDVHGMLSYDKENHQLELIVNYGINSPDDNIDIVVLVDPKK